MKYIGHLDLMRFFQKAMVRAEWPLSYTSGFHPHPQLSFAAPLSVGVTSDAEYMDVVLTKEIDINEMIDSINKNLVCGIGVTHIKQLDEKAANAMSSLEKSEYTIFFDSKKEINWCKSWQDFYSLNETINVTKKTKKGERILDIKPLIFESEMKDNGLLRVIVSSDSSTNLSPTLIINAFCDYLSLLPEDINVQINRLNMFFKS